MAVWYAIAVYFFFIMFNVYCLLVYSTLSQIFIASNELIFQITTTTVVAAVSYSRYIRCTRPLVRRSFSWENAQQKSIVHRRRRCAPLVRIYVNFIIAIECRKLWTSMQCVLNWMHNCEECKRQKKKRKEKNWEIINSVKDGRKKEKTARKITWHSLSIVRRAEFIQFSKAFDDACRYNDAECK